VVTRSGQVGEQRRAERRQPALGRGIGAEHRV
jgi:hypothetical protein